MDFRFDIVVDYLPLLLKGTLLTIGISLISILFGSVLGLPVCFGKMSVRAYLRVPMKAYIHFFRGTPLYVQILIVHFGIVPALAGGTQPIAAAVIALSLNCAAYSAEIFRAGIQSIDRGQTEAAYALGMTPAHTMQFVILPQAVKRMIPAFCNEFVVLIKDSSLVALIAVPELMYWSSVMGSQYARVWEPYLTAAFVYLILTYTLNKGLAYMEGRVFRK